MKSCRLLVLLIIFNYCFCDDNDDSVQVKFKYGDISGKVERTFLKKQNYYTFRGIPYAEPPVGKLRFKPPVPNEGWEDTYKAYNNKPTCLQHSTRSRILEPFGISGSEDCLYINIFTSNLKGSAAVIVFDYNDNFRTGFNGTDTYSPDFFIEEDVIVVTISHRLGLFGYLTAMDDNIPPNNGIKDFILGLNWIKENINAFGGDPDRVTLMGSRGGAVLVDILLRTKKAHGLFSGAILQGGTALEGTFFGKNPRKKLFEFGSLFNITTDDSAILLDELQKLNAEALIDKDGDVVDIDEIESSQLSIFPFAPVVENSDDGVIISLPENSKIINDVPIMVGMNSQEGLDLIAHYLFQPKLLDDLEGELLFLFPIRSNFRFVFKSGIYKKAIKEILNFYFEEGLFYYANLLEYAVYVGDLLQNYALNLAVRKLSLESESPVYYYMFDYKGYLNENMNYLTRYSRYSLPSGASIIDELCYLHLCTRIKKNYEDLLKLISEQSEIKVLKKMVRLWTNFAKTRNPTPDEDDNALKGFKWKPIEKDSNKMNYLQITKTLQMKVDPLEKREQFWDDFLTKYSQLAVDGVVQSNEDDDTENDKENQKLNIDDQVQNKDEETNTENEEENQAVNFVDEEGDLESRVKIVDSVEEVEDNVDQNQQQLAVDQIMEDKKEQNFMENQETKETEEEKSDHDEL